MTRRQELLKGSIKRNKFSLNCIFKVCYNYRWKA